MKALKGLFIFAAGALAGTIAGARIAKKKYEEMANEEIEEIRAYYKNKENKEEVKEEKVEEVKEETTEVTVEERKQYNDIIRRGNYMMYECEEDEEEEVKNDEPYVIDASEFGTNHCTMTCTYFADGVLVDDEDEVIEDAELVVGDHHVNIFKEYPNATTVYVRNDIDGTDYEIIKDDWCWKDFDEKGYAPPLPDASDKKPHQV